MKGTIYISGVIGQDCTLLDVIRQYKSFKNPTEVEVVIDSVGGDVYEGQSIFSYLRNLGVPITTVAKKAYSIAASIFMAGDTRIVEEGENILMIHFPFAEVSGRSDRLEAVAKELKAIEKEFIAFYNTYTNIDADSIKSLLDKETFLNSADAVSMGFATETKQTLKAVAFYNPEDENTIKPKNEIMTKIETLVKAMGDYFKVEETTEVKALVLQDANGVEINFTELEEGAEPSEGDVAMIGDSPAEGEYTSPEGAKWVFEAGALKEIIPAEAPAEEAEEEAPAEAQAQAEDDFDMADFLRQLEDSMMAKVSAKFEGQHTELKSEIVALKKLLASEDVEDKPAPSKRNTNFFQ